MADYPLVTGFKGVPVTIIEDVITDGFGWQVVGDKLIQWGSDTTSAGGTLRFTFDQAFGSTPRVTATPRFTGSISNAASINTYDPTTTQVSVQTTLVTNGGAVSNIAAVFDWIAVGEAPAALKKPKIVQTAGGTDITEFHDPTGAASYRIIGSTLECWGHVEVPTDAEVTVVFPRAFAREPATTTGSASTATSGAPRTIIPINTTATQTGFENRSSDAGNQSASNGYWHAIGQVAP